MIFVVGNSRSGTTLIGRVIGAAGAVHTFEELHFFETLVSDADARTRPHMSEAARLALAQRLLASARGNIFAPVTGAALLADARGVVDAAEGTDAVAIYKGVLAHEISRNGALDGCEQTPRYLFSLPAVLDAFPTAKVIIMIRDPRDVLLSQRSKWRTYLHGTWNMPWFEALRAWANYHPALIAKLWASAENEACKWLDHPAVLLLRFEDLAAEPEVNIRKLALHCGIPFNPAMLEVADTGSSIRPDRKGAKGVNHASSGRWRSHPLSRGEEAAIALFCHDGMARHGYEAVRPAHYRLNLCLSLPMLLIKAPLAVVLNLRRSKQLVAYVRKRFLV